MLMTAAEGQSDLLGERRPLGPPVQPALAPGFPLESFHSSRISRPVRFRFPGGGDSVGAREFDLWCLRGLRPRMCWARAGCQGVGLAGAGRDAWRLAG
jgi:hypothetical protein